MKNLIRVVPAGVFNFYCRQWVYLIYTAAPIFALILTLTSALSQAQETNVQKKAATQSQTTQNKTVEVAEPEAQAAQTEAQTAQAEAQTARAEAQAAQAEAQTTQAEASTTFIATELESSHLKPYKKILQMAAQERLHRNQWTREQAFDVNNYWQRILTPTACLLQGDATACIYQAYTLQNQLYTYTRYNLISKPLVDINLKLINTKTIAPEFVDTDNRLNDNSFVARIMLSRAAQLEQGYISQWATNRLNELDLGYEQNIESNTLVRDYILKSANQNKSWAQIRVAQMHMQFARVNKAEQILAPLCATMSGNHQLEACLNLAYTLSLQKDYIAALSAVYPLCLQGQQKACFYTYRVAAEAARDNAWLGVFGNTQRRPAYRQIEASIDRSLVQRLANSSVQITYRRNACKADVAEACFDLAQSLMPRTVCYDGECLQKNNSFWARLRRSIGYGKYTRVPLARMENVETDITFGDIIVDNLAIGESVQVWTPEVAEAVAATAETAQAETAEAVAAAAEESAEADTTDAETIAADIIATDTRTSDTIELLGQTAAVVSGVDFLDTEAITATENLEAAAAQGLPAEFLIAVDKACRLDPTDAKACFYSQWFDQYAQKTGRWFAYDPEYSVQK